MGNWTNRDTKLKQRHINKSFARPFKKKLEKERNVKERQRIREAKREKQDSFQEDDD